MIKKENIGYIEAAMSYPEVVKVVEAIADQIWHKIPDVTSFEHTAYVSCGKELRKNGGSNPRRVAMHYANRAAKRHISKTKYSPPKTFADIGYEDDDGNDVDFEPVDVLANVESEVIARKTTTLLAQGDRRKGLILSEWTNGNNADLDISYVLANVLGGNSESHRKYIQRFRISCQKALSA